MKLYLNNLINIDVTWTQDENIKRDGEGWYVENKEVFEWYKKLNRAFGVLNEERYTAIGSEVIRRLEDEGSINEWEDYIYYGEKLESVLYNGDEDWLLAYADAVDGVIDTAINEYKENSSFIGHDPYIAKEYQGDGLIVYDTNCGYIAIRK